VFPAPPTNRSRQCGLQLARWIRWLDFNDTWLAAEWASVGQPGRHPRGRRLSVARRQALRCATAHGDIKAHEIQGVLALDTASTAWPRPRAAGARASTAVVTAMLGGGARRDQIVNACRNAWIDAARCAPTARPEYGFAKELGGGDATSRPSGTRCSRSGNGYPSALSAKTGASRTCSSRATHCPAQAFGLRDGKCAVQDFLIPAEFHGRRGGGGDELHAEIGSKAG